MVFSNLKYLLCRILEYVNPDVFYSIWRRSLSYTFLYDGGPYHIEISPLISHANQWMMCSANQWTGFYTRLLSYRNQPINLFCESVYDLFCKSMDWFLYDRDLRPVRVDVCHPLKGHTYLKCTSRKFLKNWVRSWYEMGWQCVFWAKKYFFHSCEKK